MKINVIRHGKTLGNIQKRYAGRTEYDLAPEGIAELEEKAKFKVDMVFSSPMRRCLQTADIMVECELPREIIDDLIECDFGEFEDKTHEELEDNENYKNWLAGLCKDAIPGGESLHAFAKRVVVAFNYAVEKARKAGAKEIAIVTHGGVIMGLMSAVFGGLFYTYTPENGCGYHIEMKYNEEEKKCEFENIGKI